MFVCVLLNQMMMKSTVSAVALMALVVSSAQAFLSVGGNGNTHVTISGNAILTKIYEVCKAVAKSEGREFEPTVSSVQIVCTFIQPTLLKLNLANFL